jgi:8-amino-3,8-dideoxy-alpha-D-manno-octulosonate transaminase
MKESFPYKKCVLLKKTTGGRLMAGTEIFGKEELAAVRDVIERKMIHRYGSHAARNGIYRVEEFENRAREISGARHALAVANGTAALIVALKGIGIQPGDEVITSPFTFIATVEAIVACYAVPVLGDIDETLSLDPASAERLISEKPGRSCRSTCLELRQIWTGLPNSGKNTASRS